MQVLATRHSEVVRSAPKDLTKLLAVKSSLVNYWFNSFYGDVWTEDGWMITASYENNIWQVRKGALTCKVVLEPEEILYSTIIPKDWEEKKEAFLHRTSNEQQPAFLSRTAGMYLYCFWLHSDNKDRFIRVSSVEQLRTYISSNYGNTPYGYRLVNNESAD